MVSALSWIFVSLPIVYIAAVGPQKYIKTHGKIATIAVLVTYFAYVNVSLSFLYTLQLFLQLNPKIYLIFLLKVTPIHVWISLGIIGLCILVYAISYGFHIDKMQNSMHYEPILDTYVVVKRNGTRWIIKAFAKISEKVVCSCQMNVDSNANIWSISSWYTDPEYSNKGIGKKVLSEAISYTYEQFGEPTQVEYIWNRANQYVYDWLDRHFHAVCKCPIAVQKNQMEDSWDSHIYILDTDLFLQYFVKEEIL